ncbi:hypothetical protein EBT31_07060 [bacterium]|nr:hypothetical protein [bacterium]
MIWQGATPAFLIDDRTKDVMQTVKAITDRHPIFLKEAYKMDGIVDLIDDERYLARGDRFVRFDAPSFVVCIKTADASIKVSKFNNLRSAVNYARRV